ncbi:uncharacterized protein [Penaeus vannamei]|uniref:uncharacterized protein isoform X1 n=2 Tax=Penaeus vannamei TaxID=6689 RepID=UPI00387F6EB5
MVVGVRIQVKMRNLLMEWNRNSQRSSMPPEAELQSMVPLGITALMNHKAPTPSRATPPPPTPSPHPLRPFMSRGLPMETHFEENDDSSGYSSSHAHSFRSFNDLSADRPQRPNVWENHHSC